MASGNILTKKYTSFLKKNYFDVSLFVNPKILFLMKGVFIFKTEVYQKKYGMRFTLYVNPFYFTNIFYKKYFHKCFSYFQNINRDRTGTSLVSFLSLNIIGIISMILKCFV
jgi:hypothetical protein